MPELDKAEYLHGWLDQLGWCKVGAMGGVMPLDWAEMDAYYRVMAIEPDQFEAATVRGMTVAYCNGYAKGIKKGGWSPVVDATADPAEKARLKAVAIRAAMRR